MWRSTSRRLNWFHIASMQSIAFHYLCSGSVCQWQIWPISYCLPVDVCKHSQIHVHTVTHASCMCADLNPSCFMQHCCARKWDSPQPVTHSGFALVDIQKTTGPQVTIKNEMHYAVWLYWHVSLCLCQQRNEFGSTAHPYLTLSACSSSRSQHTSLLPAVPVKHLPSFCRSSVTLHFCPSA